VRAVTATTEFSGTLAAPPLTTIEEKSLGGVTMSVVAGRFGSLTHSIPNSAGVVAVTTIATGFT